MAPRVRRLNPVRAHRVPRSIPPACGPVPGRVAFLHGDEEAAAGRGHLAVAVDVAVDGGAVLADAVDARLQPQRLAGGGGALEADVEVGGDGALRRVPAPLVHEAGGGAP